MNILITAGGTTEKIDEVRQITNHSTGATGKALAEAFMAKGHHVYYVTTKEALQPSQVTEKFFITDTKELAETLTHLLTTISFQGVIQAMAISDFTLQASFSKEAFQEVLAEKKDPFQIEKPAFGTKISSDTEQLVLVLKKTPKIINLIKNLKPKTHLIGFKLLVGVTKEELLTVAKERLIQNQADLIVANDLTEVQKNFHHAYLVTTEGLFKEVHTNEELATTLCHFLEEKQHD